MSFQIRVGGGGVVGDRKSSENDKWTGHFQSVLISPEQTVKLVM